MSVDIEIDLVQAGLTSCISKLPQRGRWGKGASYPYDHYWEDVCWRATCLVFSLSSEISSKNFSLFATHFYNYPYPQSGCMSPELLNCLRIVCSKSFMINLTLTSSCESYWGMILKQLVHAYSSRKFLGECVLLFILDSKAFGGNRTSKHCKGLIWKGFFSFEHRLCFFVTFYVGNNS